MKQETTAAHGIKVDLESIPDHVRMDIAATVYECVQRHYQQIDKQKKLDEQLRTFESNEQRTKLNRPRLERSNP